MHASKDSWLQVSEETAKYGEGTQRRRVKRKTIQVFKRTTADEVMNNVNKNAIAAFDFPFEFEEEDFCSNKKWHKQCNKQTFSRSDQPGAARQSETRGLRHQDAHV